MSGWGRRSWIAAAVVSLAAGTAWATSHEVPPPWALPGAPVVAGWQEFVTYREALRWFGGAVLGLTVVLVLSHFAVYGAHHVRPRGRLVRRYRVKEVLLHALLALAFLGAWATSTYLVLAKYVLGQGTSGGPVPLGGAASAVHIAAGFVFLGTLLALGALWWRSMGFAPYDRAWLRELGGYFSRRHPILPAGRFNAGQKIWFRLAWLVGVAVGLSGALSYYPGLLGVTAGIGLYMLHTSLAVLFSAAVIAHVYLTMLVHPCTVRAMVTGEIDEACLREDHPLEPLPAAEGAREESERPAAVS